MRRCASVVLLPWVLLWADQGLADGSLSLPLHQNGGGSLEVELQVAGRTESFLLDTGANMVTINSALAKRLTRAHRLEPVREVAGRMADGRIRRLQVYSTDAVVLDPDCEAREIEVLVVPGKGRNLLGMNLLSGFAPITLGMSPPTLGLSSCTVVDTVAGNPDDSGAQADVASLTVPTPAGS